MRFHGQIVGQVEILVLKRRPRLGDIALDLRDGVLLISAECPGQAAQILLRRSEQLIRALLHLRGRRGRCIRSNLRDRFFRRRR